MISWRQSGGRRWWGATSEQPAVAALLHRDPECMQAPPASAGLLSCPSPEHRRNGRIVMLREVPPAGDLLFFALGTGEYTELARE